MLYTNVYRHSKIRILLRLLIEHLLCQEEIAMMEYVCQYYMVSLCDIDLKCVN